MSGKRAKAQRAVTKEMVERAIQEKSNIKKELQRRVSEMYLEKHNWFIENEIYCMAFTLRRSFGFGQKRLKRFAENYKKNWQELTEYYGEGNLDAPYLAREVLIHEGIDISTWDIETKTGR